MPLGDSITLGYGTPARAFPINGDWLTVNTMKDIKFVENFLKKKQMEGKWLR